MPHIMGTIALKQTVAESIQEFYNKNNFGEEGGKYERFVWIKFGFFSIPIPNFQSRSQNVYLHDVSHIVTAYDTTWKGESGVSAWEIASGGWGKLYMPWLLTLWAMGLGVLFYPTNTLKSFKQGLTMRNAFTCGLTKSEIFSLSVSDLRNVLSNKPKNNKNPFIWMFLSFVVFIFPFLLGSLIIWMLLTFVYFMK